MKKKDALNCYKYILGREPGKEELLTGDFENFKELNELRDVFITSPEFIKKYGEKITQLKEKTNSEFMIIKYIGDNNQTNPFWWVVRSDADDEITHGVLNHNIFYEPLELLDILQIDGSNPVLLDIGGNIGAFSLNFAARGWKCYAIEASEKNIEAFDKSIKMNQFDISILKYILHEKTGKMYFHQDGPYGFVSNNVFDSFDCEELNSICLDDWMNTELSDIEKIDFIKLDIEGSEVAALRGGGKFLENYNYPPVFCEINKWTLYLQNETPNSLILEFEKMGYNSYKIENGKLFEYDSKNIQMLINDNYLFIKDIDKYKKLIVGKCPTSDFNKLKMELKEKFDNGDLVYLAGTLNSLKDFDDYWMDNDIQETVKAVKNKFINNNLIKNL